MRRRSKKKQTEAATEQRMALRAARAEAKRKEKKQEQASKASISIEKEDRAETSPATNKNWKQMSVKEKFSDAYRRVGPECSWKPPRSEYNLLQEQHSFDHWRVMVICFLLNMSNGHKVGQVLEKLFDLCPDARTTVNARLQDISNVIYSVGLHNRKAKLIKKFSQAYLDESWTHVTQLPGVGKYAADAYAIFCAGKAEKVTPRDHMLVYYWKFVLDFKSTEKDDIPVATNV